MKKEIVYLGIEKPETPIQVRAEICGLKHAIKVAEELIARLEQALTIAALQQEELKHDGSQKESCEESKGPKTKKGDEVPDKEAEAAT